MFLSAQQNRGTGGSPSSKGTSPPYVNIFIYILFVGVKERQHVVSSLCSQMKEAKEKEEPKTIPLRVFGKGINSFAVVRLPSSVSYLYFCMCRVSVIFTKTMSR